MSGFVEVLVEFKSTEQGGRRSPVWLANGRYMPHLCVHNSDGEYLGVEFVDGPDRLIASGEECHATVRFMYEPEVSYAALVEGATFDICEGGSVVGVGRVVRR